MVSDSGVTVPRWLVTSVLFLAALIFPLLVIYHTPYSSWIYSPCQNVGRLSTVKSSSENSTPPFSENDSEEVRLDKVLKKAAMSDRTVILAPLNAAWAAPGSVLDLFLESFRIGERTEWLLNHLVLVALDEKAYAHCLTMHPHCFALTTGLNSSKEAYFMTPEYMEMVWKKIDFLRSVLQLGYNFIFSDADIMWFRDPFPRFDEEADFQVTCDNFRGNPDDLNNRPNTGFKYVRSNNRTVEFYKYWYDSRKRFPRNHDQDAFNRFKFDQYIVQIGVKIRFFNTAYFGGFCEPSRSLTLVRTMHANCCFGLENKLHDLRIMLDEWKTYFTSLPSVKKSWSSSWSVPQNCGIKHHR